MELVRGLRGREKCTLSRNYEGMGKGERDNDHQKERLGKKGIGVSEGETIREEGKDRRKGDEIEDNDDRKKRKENRRRRVGAGKRNEKEEVGHNDTSKKT